MRLPLVALVLAGGCAASAPLQRSTPDAARAASASATALAHGDDLGALSLAERGLARHPNDPWLLYDKGAAQAGLGRVDDALATLDRAERHFATPHERSLAVYRRAIALEQAGRCADASRELGRYAALVQKRQPWLAAEALAHRTRCTPPAMQAEVAALSTDATRALAAGDHAAALAKANAGLALAPDDAWLIYDQGSALAGLGRTDEALAALRRAEQRFGEHDPRGRALAIYRGAMALDAAGRCDDEARELQRYALLARPADREFVAHAVRHVRVCTIASAQSY
jgi:tetratricopeptide (TPR) repeat protein